MNLSTPVVALNSVPTLFPALARLAEHPFWDGRATFDLTVPAALLNAFDNPQDAIQTVHVTGTNGKGSVCTFVAAIAIAAGERVGQFCSPHLMDVTERCLIDGTPVAPGIFNDAVAAVYDQAEQLQLTPSYFEIVTVASFLVFRAQGVALAVIEVGLGGRLDATNCLRKPKVTAITSIGFDHTHLLGNSEAAIATEKAGIIKEGVPVVVGALSESAAAVISARAVEMHVTAYSLGRDFLPAEVRLLVNADGEALTIPALGRLVGYQRGNGAVAARIGLLLGYTPSQINTGLLRARWPGRLEHLSIRRRSDGEQIPIVLDAAHNEAGFEELLAFLREYVASNQYASVSFVLSFLETKNWKAILSQLRQFAVASPFAVQVTFSRSQHRLAVVPEVLQQHFASAAVVADAAAAVEQTIAAADKHSLVVITGSIYFLGEVRPMVTDLPFRTYAEGDAVQSADGLSLQQKPSCQG